MSGWDVSSTPTWGPQDGPDETQTFTAQGDGSRDFGSQDFGARDFGRIPPDSPAEGFPEASDGFYRENSPGGPPPEFFAPGYGQQDQQEPGPGGFPQRTPGRSLPDVPGSDGRVRYSPTQENAYDQNGAYSQDVGYGQDAGYGQNGGYGGDGAYGGDDWGGSAEAADGRTVSRQDNGGGWGRTAGRPVAPWEEAPQQDVGYQDAGGPGFGGQDLNRQGFGQQGFGDRGFGPQDFGGQDFGRRSPGRPGFPADDYGGEDFPAQEHAGQAYAGQRAPGPQEPQAFDRQDQDMAARMDPALQDFFSPQSGGAPGYPERRRPGEPRDSRYRQDDDDDWGAPSRPQEHRTGTGPRTAPRGAGSDGPRKGLGVRAYIAIGAVVAIVIVVGAVVLTHGSGGASPDAGSTPGAGTMSSPVTQPSAGKSAVAGTGAAAASYVLSTPATAGGYQKGQYPQFLATATATAQQVVTAVTGAHGGTPKGSPVSAAYTLPLSQTVTFVGYQGTFTPAKVATALASLGTDEHTYPAGPHGGILGCVNTPSTAMETSGAVCVWSTTSTLGITEFFNSTGPEALTQSQDKGATDTVNVRADVEAKS